MFLLFVVGQPVVSFGIHALILEVIGFVRFVLSQSHPPVKYTRLKRSKLFTQKTAM